MDIKITLPNFNKEFGTNIRNEIQTKINQSMSRIVANIKDRLQILFIGLIKQSDTYNEIQAGRLRGELGLADPSVLDSIILKWAEGIVVKYSIGKQFGTININMIQSDYSDVLTLPEASYVYISERGSGVIDWLRWLLLEGPSAIVLDYQFVRSFLGRTGIGIMVNKAGRSWAVPPQHAGTAADNFVTRALQDIEQEIDIIVRQEITKGIS